MGWMGPGNREQRFRGQKHLGKPLLALGMGLQRGQHLPVGCPLHSRPLGCGPAVSSLPLCGWKLLLARKALTKAPLTLSPSDFPSRGFEELGLTGTR